MKCILIFASILTGIFSLQAQDHSHHTSSNPGACCKAPTMRKVMLPPPLHIEGIGKSHITITTKSDSAQKYFDQGISLMHDFWDFEAYRAFEYAAKLDSTAPMAYWGMYISLPANDENRKKDRQQALEKAKKFQNNGTAQEKLYIQAILDEEAQGLDQEKANKAYVKAMDHLISKYPDDAEAKLFQWLAVSRGYEPDGKPREGTMYADQLLRNLLRTHPEHHGVHHYWIHQMENCCPKEALESADKLASLAPKSGHIVHMPGHIYYRIGEYKRARQSFLASMTVDSTYIASQKVDKVDNWNYTHNLNYLIANDAEEGRYREAIAMQEKLLKDFPMVQEVDHLTHKAKPNAFQFQITVFQAAELEMRFGYWKRATERLARIADADTLSKTDWLPHPLTLKKLLLAYAKGMEAVENGKLDLAKRYAEELDATIWRASKQEKTVPESADKRFNVHSYELQGSIYSLAGDTAKAFQLLKEAVKLEKELGYREPPPYHRPAKLTLAEAYLHAKLWQKARTIYEEVLTDRPNSGYALFGIAQAWEKEGKKAEAAKAYNHFLTVWSEADPDLPQVKKAKTWQKSNGSLARN